MEYDYLFQSDNNTDDSNLSPNEMKSNEEVDSVAGTTGERPNEPVSGDTGTDGGGTVEPSDNFSTTTDTPVTMNSNYVFWGLNLIGLLLIGVAVVKWVKRKQG